MKNVFERHVLYEEVWQTPLTTLAKKYQLSDNGLRKICKALDIPLPVVGHWARIAAGHKIERPPLPSTSGPTKFVSNPPPQYREDTSPEDAAWLAEWIAFEAQPENKCEVDLPPRKWHRMMIPIRDGLRSAQKELEAWRRSEQRRAKDPRATREPNFDGMRWHSFDDNGQVLVATGAAAPVRASVTNYERSLAILNGLCFCAERRGFAVSRSEKTGRLLLTQGVAEVEVRLTEKLNDAWRRETRWGGKPENVKYKVPSGTLRIHVGHSYSETEFAESPGRPLETRLNDVFVGVYRRVVRELENARRQARYERERAESERLRAIAEAQRREEAARQEAERKKRQALIDEAGRWRTAELIREYVKRRDGEVSMVGGADEHGEWRTWALNVADDIDPIKRH